MMFGWRKVVITVIFDRTSQLIGGHDFKTYFERDAA